MRNKQVEFNPYIYQNCTVLATKYPFFNTKHPVIILRGSLFVVTPAHVASWKNGCENFSYVYRSRKHCKCKYWPSKAPIHYAVNDVMINDPCNDCTEAVRHSLVLYIHGNPRSLYFIKRLLSDTSFLLICFIPATWTMNKSHWTTLPYNKRDFYNFHITYFLCLKATFRHLQLMIFLFL